ncbi:HK97 family phage prohead protease [Xanthobacter versatilis]|uniref:HK97 family phage prohead protease n=1 Tax=Xanthobacter autotrophicus (strain ATCC BAA-1158 / Py2) TaxID=78245 RepID=UPI00372A1921
MGDPRTLYVSRPLLNGAELIDWAKGQGFTKTVPADDLHVTIAYSRDPVDWAAAGDHFDQVRARADGPRSVEQLGDKGAVVLRFEHAELAQRWQAFRDIGASWDHDGYRPHVTITYDGAGVDLSKVQPFSGELVFGPEEFAEIDEDWADRVRASEKGRRAMETKIFPLELKEVTETRTFSGYGAVFGNVDQGRDVVIRGAFAESLAGWRAKGKLPKMLWQHNPHAPIGIYTEMREDDYGLFVKGRFTDGVQQADEAYALMKDGALDGLSIGYSTVDDEIDRAAGIRKLVKLDLWEVSTVTFQMNLAAGITDVKAQPKPPRTIREFEAGLREKLGFSHAQAKSIASSGFKSLEPRDEDGAMNDLLRTIKGIRAGL